MDQVTLDLEIALRHSVGRVALARRVRVEIPRPVRQRRVRNSQPDQYGQPDRTVQQAQGGLQSRASRGNAAESVMFVARRDAAGTAGFKGLVRGIGAAFTRMRTEYAHRSRASKTRTRAPGSQAVRQSPASMRQSPARVLASTWRLGTPPKQLAQPPPSVLQTFSKPTPGPHP